MSTNVIPPVKPGKLLVVSDAWHPQVNGVVRTYENISEEIEAMGCEVKVIGPADFPRSVPMPGYEEIKLVIAPYGKLKKMIDEYNPDYIHAATEGPLGWATRKYCLKHGRKFTTCYHTQFPAYFAKRVAKHLPFIYKPAHELAKKFIFVFHGPAHAMMVATKSLEDELLSWGFKTPMSRFTRGINTDIFHLGEKNLFKDLKRPVAVFVGRVAIEKNLEAYLSMEWEGTKVVVGDGPAMKYLREKFPDAVFVGKKTGKELADHYRSADIFVFPSKTDTFGMVLVEAMACGLPIAGYDVIGPRDIVTEEFLGCVGDDLAQVSKKALKSGGDPKKRYEHAAENYSWQLAARQFMGAFN